MALTTKRKLKVGACFIGLVCFIVSSANSEDEPKKTSNVTDPCTDFYYFACENYLNSNAIPDDKYKVDPHSDVNDELQQQIRILLEEPSLPNEERPFQLAKNYYQTCMNESAIEEQGLEPLQQIIKELGGWPVFEGSNWNESEFDWMDFYVKSQKMGFSFQHFLDIEVKIDIKNTSKFLLHEMHGNPSENRLRSIRKDSDNSDAFVNMWYQTVNLLGTKSRTAVDDLISFASFYNKMSSISEIPNDLNNIKNLYNPMTISELTIKYPSIPWKKCFYQLLPSDVQIDDNGIVIITRPKYIEDLEKLLNATNKRTLANYMMWKIVEQSIEYLNNDFRQLKFEYEKILAGKSKTDPRWKQCVDFVKNDFPPVVAVLYARKYFDNDAIKNAEEIVTDIRDQYIEILSNVSWIDNKTKKYAIEKVLSIANRIGCSPKLFNNTILDEYYKDFEPFEKSFLQGQLKLKAFNKNFMYKQLTKPVNKDDWIHYNIPVQVNAFYSPVLNSMILPASIFQGIFFNKTYPRYMNYGGIGFVIAHEMTHALDDNGKLLNKDGNLDNWWSPSTDKNYIEKVQCFIDQYGNYTFTGVNATLNTNKTVGENIADNSGFKVAYYAYLNSLKNHGTEEKLPNNDWTPKQMFWISAARGWCTATRPEILPLVLKQDSHSPPELRIHGSFSNMPEFSKDFNCPIGSKMNPIKKCSFW